MLSVSSITPDWSQCWTAKEAEAELGGRFKFAGCGWYLVRTQKGGIDSMLVLPRSEHLPSFAGLYPEDTVFKFSVYNGRCPAADMSAIANAPVRQDERGEPGESLFSTSSFGSLAQLIAAVRQR